MAKYDYTAAYYTVHEVAEKLGITRQTVYKWIWNGDMKAVKLGAKLYRVPVEEVQRAFGGWDK